MKAHFSVLPGGRYRAKQNPDGTWDVLDVPMFSLVPKGTKKAPKDLKEKDLRSAVQTHRKLFSEDSFLPPLNVLHNFGLHKPKPAGRFLPQSVRPLKMGGKIRPTVYADLLAISNDVFLQMDRGELPYLSAEVRTYEPLEFGALALLDTESPFFQFPNITIGQKDATAVRLDDHGGPALAVAGNPSAFLFRFREGDMPEDEKPDEIEPGDGQMEEGEGDLKGAISAIEAKMKEFAPLLELLPKLQEMLAGPAEEEEEIDAEPADEAPAAMSADTETTKMQARVAALEDYRDGEERQKTMTALSSGEVKSLESEGYSLSDATKARLKEAAGKGKDVLELFAATYRETAIKDPSPDLDDLPAGDTAWPSEVMAYANQGAEKFAAAQEGYLEWSELPDDRLRSPIEKYLERKVG